MKTQSGSGPAKPCGSGGPSIGMSRGKCAWNSVADTAPERADTSPSKRCRVRSPTRLDGRTVIFRRVAELRGLFTNALKDAGVELLKPMRRMKVDEAAQLKALAEKARPRARDTRPETIAPTAQQRRQIHPPAALCLASWSRSRPRAFPSNSSQLD